MTYLNGHGSLRIFVTGFRLSIRDLCEGLGAQPGIELLGTAGDMGTAASALGASKVDVVLHKIPPGTLPQNDLSRIRELTRAPIVLLAEGADLVFLDKALEADVADVVVLPQPVERVAFTVRKAARVAASQAGAADGARAQVITVFSPKGGTGKTVVSSNLAAGIAKREGLRTLLLDLDLQFGDAAIMLGIEPEQTLHDLVIAPGKLDAEKLSGYLTHHAGSGLDVLAGPLRPEEGELVAEQGVERLLEVARAAYDVIVVDTSPSFHGPTLSALDCTDVLLLLCTPEVPTLKNVRLGIETLRRLSVADARMSLVLNRADAGAGIRRPEVEGALGMAVSYELPNTPDVPAAVNRGAPLTLTSPSVEFSAAVRQMSQSLLGRKRSSKAWSDLYSVNGTRSGFVSKARGLAAVCLPPARRHGYSLDS
ncbi:MAG TPA: AAA family ATPase [Gaiellaceae bacterium]